MSSKWFTSDTHFSHANILHLGEGRPFDTVEEMNETLIDNWNSVVNPADTVYHLGDVALGPIKDSLPLVGRLNGYKLLVPGNHDRVWLSNKQRDRFMPLYLEVFDEVMLPIETIRFDDRWVALSHLPYSGDSGETDRYDADRPFDTGLPLLHGHTHASQALSKHPRQFSVGVDAHAWFPCSEDVVRSWLSAL